MALYITAAGSNRRQFVPAIDIELSDLLFCSFDLIGRQCLWEHD